MMDTPDDQNYRASAEASDIGLCIGGRLGLQSF
jgi:hypothetical protein